MFDASWLAGSSSKLGNFSLRNICIDLKTSLYVKFTYVCTTFVYFNGIKIKITIYVVQSFILLSYVCIWIYWMAWFPEYAYYVQCTVLCTVYMYMHVPVDVFLSLEQKKCLSALEIWRFIVTCCRVQRVKYFRLSLQKIRNAPIFSKDSNHPNTIRGTGLKISKISLKYNIEHCEPLYPCLRMDSL